MGEKMTQVINKNQERIKKVTVLANENKYSLEPFTKRCATTHKDTLIEFIYETGIEIHNGNIFRISSQELAYYLVEQGFSVILQTEENNKKEITIYLPELLGINQRQYLNRIISMLKNCTLSVFKINSKDKVLNYCFDASSNVVALIDFIKKLPDYTINANKTMNLQKKPQKNQ